LNKILKYFSIGSIGLVLLYISPIFLGLPKSNIDEIFPFVIMDEDYQVALLRTLVFSILTTFLVIIISFIFGYLLRKFTDKSFLLYCSILLIPFLLGSVSVAFIFKVLLWNTDFLTQIFNSSIYLFLLLGFFQFWQYGTLFIYIFWLNNFGVKKEIVEYSAYYKFTTFEKLKHIYLPFHRNLIILLSIFFFAVNVYESTKLQIIFRASKGTNSEMLSSLFYNTYISESKISPEFATNNLFSQALLFYLPLLLFITFLIYFFINLCINGFSKNKTVIGPIFTLTARSKNTISKVFVFLIILIVILPILAILLKQSISIADMEHLIKTISLSLVASVLLLVVFVLPLAYFLRIGYKDYFEKITRQNLWIFLSLFLLYLVPPLCLMLFGFEWSSFLGISGELSTTTAWIIGQCINALPIIASFVFVIHFVVKNNEIEYLQTMRASTSEIIKWSFIKRFRIEYIMTFIFTFSTIWNEGTFNKIYSDTIPSYVSEILRTVNSRNADYSVGMLYFLFSLTLAIICVGLWNVIIYKLSKTDIA
jgi:ABC-type sugar transport system permease subunit